MNQAETLDCQECGEVVRTLDPYEADQVARNPYKFIVYCAWCKEDIKKANSW